MSWNAQRFFLCALILATGCKAMLPPPYLAIIEYFNQLSQQTAASGDAPSGSNLAPTYGEFVKAFQNEKLSKGSYTIHGPQVLALAELIAETVKINEKLARLSGSSVNDNAAADSSASGFDQLSFSDFNSAIQEDLTSMEQMNGIEPYVPPAIKLLAANLHQINSRVDALENRSD